MRRSRFEFLRARQIAGNVVFWTVLLTLLCEVSVASAETIGRCGQGWLERIDGQLVLHLKGTPYEMGYQHGALLKEHVQSNMEYLLRVKGDTELARIGPLKLKPTDAIRLIIGIQLRHVPQKYLEEMEGLAKGAGVSVEDVRLANFIPELFHCSGFALMNSATEDGTLYHGRVLDYAVDWRLQEHAVIIVAEPEGGLPFVNVGFAGFIGSVTGMSAAQVSIGEMGGGGLGKWDGVPMAFLVREVLQTAQDLEAAIRVFRDNPRTCQYFFVIADAKTNRAVGMEASADRFELIRPGQAHPMLPEAIPDCVLLSAGARYKELVRRVKAGHGRFTTQSALRLMDRPVAMSSNLHNVLFEPKSTRFWVAIASKDGQPAATQPYHGFQLSELLKRRPAAGARELPFIAQKASQKK